MRPQQNNNYKNRNRNRNRRHSSGGGSGGGGGPNNRVLDSNGPDVKLRGTPQTIAEKYMQLARDAHSSGDRVMAESYYQHADHYYRLWLAAQPAGQPVLFPRRLDEDVEDLEGGEGEDDAGVEAPTSEMPEGADVAPAVEGAAAGEGQAGDDGQQNRNFRNREQGGREQGGREQNNRDQNGGSRDRPRNRWPRRNDRNAENRDGNGPAPEAQADDADRPERTHAPERNERPSRRDRAEVAPESGQGGDWEAPSFLKRPLPVVAGDDADLNDAPAASAARPPRARRPRYGEDGVTANEPTVGED